MCTGPPDIFLLLIYAPDRLLSPFRNVQRLVGGVGAICRAEATCLYTPHSQIHGQQVNTRAKQNMWHVPKVTCQL